MPFASPFARDTPIRSIPARPRPRWWWWWKWKGNGDGGDDNIDDGSDVGGDNIDGGDDGSHDNIDGSDDNIDDGGDDIDGGYEVISQPLVSSIICLSLKNLSAPSKDLIINKILSI